MDLIRRTTSTGRVLTLVELSPGNKAAEVEDDMRADVRAVLQDTWALVKQGAIEDVCVIGVGACGAEILSTIPDLGELALARDELTDMIDEARRGE